MLFNQREIKKIPHYSGIYEIITFGDRSYIGESMDVHRRLMEHLYYLGKRKHFNKILQDLYIISDWNFIPPLEFKILEVVEKNGHTHEQLNKILLSKEKSWIKKRDSTLLMNQFTHFNFPKKKVPISQDYHQREYTSSEITEGLGIVSSFQQEQRDKMREEEMEKWWKNLPQFLEKHYGKNIKEDKT